MKINQELFFSKKCEITDPGDAKEQLSLQFLISHKMSFVIPLPLFAFN